MKRGLNTTPTRRKSRPNLKIKKAKSAIVYYDQQDLTSESTFLSPPPTMPSIVDAHKPTAQFHNDDSNMDLDIVWDDGPEISTPISNNNRPFVHLESFLKGFPDKESPVTRKQVMSLAGMDQKGEIDPATSKSRRKQRSSSDSLSRLRNMAAMLQRSHVITRDLSSPVKENSSLEDNLKSSATEGEGEEESSICEDVLGNSFLNHSSLIQQLFSADSFDDSSVSTVDQTKSLAAPTVNEPTQNPSGSASHVLAATSSCVTCSSSVIPGHVDSFAALDHSERNSMSKPYPGARSFGLKPKPDPEYSTHSVSLRPAPQVSSTFKPHPDTSLKPKPLQDKSLRPAPQLSSTHPDTCSSSLKPNTGQGWQPQAHACSTSLRPKPAPAEWDDNDNGEDDVFWTQVAQTMDVGGCNTPDTDIDTDSFLLNLDNESMKQLFQFDDDTEKISPPTQRVCSQGDIERKKQQAKLKLQRKLKTF